MIGTPTLLLCIWGTHSSSSMAEIREPETDDDGAEAADAVVVIRGFIVAAMLRRFRRRRTSGQQLVPVAASMVMVDDGVEGYGLPCGRLRPVFPPNLLIADF